MDSRLPYILTDEAGSAGLVLLVTNRPLVACFLGGHILHAGSAVMRDCDQFCASGSMTVYDRWTHEPSTVPVNEIITAAQAACLLGRDDDGSCGCVISKHRRHNAPRVRQHVRCGKVVCHGR